MVVVLVGVTVFGVTVFGGDFGGCSVFDADGVFGGNAEAVGVPVVVVALVGVTMTGLVMFGVTMFGDVTMFGGDCVGDAVLDADDVFGGNPPEDAGRG